MTLKQQLIAAISLGIILVSLMAAQNAKADDSISNFGHFTGMFVGTTVSYGLCKKMFHMEPVPAYLFSLVLGTSIGLAKEMLDKEPSGNDMLYNLGGAAGAGATILMFEF